MLNSIQHFIENGVPNLQKASKDFSEDPKDFAGFVYRVRNASKTDEGPCITSHCSD
ncbi:hypothetical protein [Butyrivibrio sp. JL13D10]|uniref:hypothetical protein n=1 Tax=Butyrivibrio sp. JL13D10 TaxID=3236815 RepID=UPI0038B5F6CD